VLEQLIAQGEALFFEETFGGNGRTCGTCHPAGNNLTIDPDFIANLPADAPGGSFEICSEGVGR
jgi:cytochrome c peroxidase